MRGRDGIRAPKYEEIGRLRGAPKKRFRKTRCFQAGYIDDIYIYLAFLRISNRGSEKFLSIWRMLCPNRC
jgi:hypothetical protein